MNQILESRGSFIELPELFNEVSFALLRIKEEHRPDKLAIFQPHLEVNDMQEKRCQLDQPFFALQQGEVVPASPLRALHSPED